MTRPGERARPWPHTLSGLAVAATALGALGACSGGGSSDASGDAPSTTPAGASVDAAGNALTYAGRTRALTDAIVVDYGATGAHYNVDVDVADDLWVPTLLDNGSFLTTDYIAYDSTAEFSADLYSPGSDGFRTGTFGFFSGTVSEVGDAPASLAGRAVFAEADVGVDLDGSGAIEDGEYLDVVDGTVSLAIVQGGIELAFDVLLVDGQRASGRYDGPATYFDERE